MNLKNGFPFVPVYQRVVSYLPGIAPIRSASTAMGPMATSSVSSYPYAVMLPQNVGGSYYISNPYLPATSCNPLQLQLNSPTIHSLAAIEMGGTNLVMTGPETTSTSDDEIHTISRKPVMYNSDSEHANDTLFEDADANFTELAHSTAHCRDLFVATTTSSSVISTSTCQDNYTSDYHSDTSVNQCDLVSESDASGRSSDLSSLSGLSKGDCGATTSLISSTLPVTSRLSELEHVDTYTQKTGFSHDVVLSNWRREIENNDNVIYVSPDGVRLASLSAVYAWQESRATKSTSTSLCLCHCGHELLSLALLKNIFHFNKDTVVECDGSMSLTQSQSLCLHVFGSCKEVKNEDGLAAKEEQYVTSSCSLKRQASPLHDPVNCAQLQAKRFCSNSETDNDRAQDETNQPTKCSTPVANEAKESIEDDVQALHDYLTAQELAMAREAAIDRQLNEEKNVRCGGSAAAVDMEISSEFGQASSFSAVQSPESRLVIHGQGVTWASLPSAADSAPITSLSAAAFFQHPEPTQMTWMAAATPTASVSHSFPFVNFYHPYAAVASPYLPWMDYSFAAGSGAPFYTTPNFLLSSAAAAPAQHSYISATQVQALAAAQIQMQMQTAQLQAQYAAMAAAVTAAASSQQLPSASSSGGGVGENLCASSSAMTPNKLA